VVGGVGWAARSGNRARASEREGHIDSCPRWRCTVPMLPTGCNMQPHLDSLCLQRSFHAIKRDVCRRIICACHCCDWSAGRFDK